MERKPYKPAVLFSGVISSVDFDEGICKKIEERVGKIERVTPPFPFDFTNYYEKEIGRNLSRFFILFKEKIFPDEIGRIKIITNDIEKEEGRKIDIDPGYITASSVVLASTKDRAQRIAIGENLYAEVTLLYHKKGWQDLPWTYPDYRTEKVKSIMTSFRESLFKDKQ